MTPTPIPSASVAPTLPPDAQGYAQAVATKKYIDLANDLGKKLGYITGWRGEVARQLGISSSLLSQIYLGRKRVTRGTLDKAIEALHLASDHFGSDEELAAVPRTVNPPVPPPHAPDPLLIIEAFEALDYDMRRRVLAVLNNVGKH